MVSIRVRFGVHLIGSLVLAFGYHCHAQVITVWVVDQRNGHPQMDKPVSLTYKDERGMPTKVAPWLKTDADGKARFTLPEPFPARLTVYVSLEAEHWWCGCSVSAATSDVVKNGLVGPEDGYVRGKAWRVKPLPGEVIILARPWGVLARILIPILAPLERE